MKINDTTKHSLYIILSISLFLFLSSCSTTKHLPDEGVLYTGIKEIKVEDPNTSPAGKEALNEVEAALAFAPNNALLGSSSVRIPFPMGLWFYSGFKRYTKGPGKWIFNKFAKKPILTSTVNPNVRIKVAQNILHEYGFFKGTTAYTVLPNEKDPRKAKLAYTIKMGQPYLYDTINYVTVDNKASDIIQHTAPKSLLRVGDNFSVIKLEAERQRLSKLLRDTGYYYFRPNFIEYLADTVQTPYRVNLRILPKEGLPAMALHPWKVGDISFYLTGDDNEVPNKQMRYKNLDIHYHDKLNIRPSVLYRRMRLKEGALYTAREQARSQQNLARLGVFKYTEMQFMPKDTLETTDTLDLRVNAAFDLPLDGELELNVTTKSNNQTGPGSVFSVSKRNFFKGGEVFSVKLRASYEWQTGKRVDGNSAAINSYEFGASTDLTLPYIAFPRLYKKDYTFPATTTFSLYGDQLNRSGFFKMLSFGGHATYNFQSSVTSRHSLTPFKLNYTLLNGTPEFESIMEENPALALSLKNQFIPSMGYTYTYDNAKLPTTHNPFWWESSITSAGNILSGVYAIFGHGFNEKKELLGNAFAQFTKLTSEVRYHYKIDKNQTLAMRFMAGAIYAYGNSTVAPYNEQFYIGGANSIRAFTVRSIGPGSFRPAPENEYAYIDQTGDLKIEANIEYRFRIFAELHGATFLDAGNIWLLKNDPLRPGGQFKLSGLGQEIALGTGVGLRYDLSVIVLRFDMGIALHAPYDTGKKGYYNIPSFKDGIGWHLAIGYPF